jgi:DNA-binding PadR family transcriptional regulator
MVKENKLSNEGIVTVALYVLGSGIGTFHLETIAKKADELAPARFRWMTDPEMISDRNTWSALSNARKKGFIVQKANEKNTHSYQLTEEGVKFSEKNINIIKNFDQSKIRIPVSKEIYENTKNRLVITTAYQKVKNSKENDISTRELNQFFRLNDYMKNSQKEEKIQKMKNLFINDKEFKKVIDKVASTLTKENNNER